MRLRVPRINLEDTRQKAGDERTLGRWARGTSRLRMPHSAPAPNPKDLRNCALLGAGEASKYLWSRHLHRVSGYYEDQMN